MIRHPHYLDIPWEIHWQGEPQTGHRRLWWLVVGITLLALFLVGVGVISGTLL
jgi:hypothetical protein